MRDVLLFPKSFAEGGIFVNKSTCNICGGNLINKNGRWVCESCGAFLPEEITSEQLILLYNANQKLRLADFDAAEEAYSDIIRKYGDCSDAYFGRALAHYGIRFERDVDGQMIPTCFFPEYQSLVENSDFKKAYDLADSKQKQYLKEKADEIETIRKEWNDKAKKEEPYDVFISFKATEVEDDTKETEDSREAWDIARELEKSGYKVFFSKDALANKTGDHYEPYIFNAINTCHVMLVYASKPEYVESVWVRNEWTRYWKKIKNKEDGKLPNSLILIYKNFNPSKELSGPFSHSENINRNDIDFLDRLKNYVSSVLSKSKIITPKIIPNKIENYLPPKNEKLKGAKKKKTGCSIIPNGNFVPSIHIQEKTFGKYSTQKLTGTAESELSKGDVLLSRKFYADALECYKGVLLNNTNNAKAALGMLLSKTECTNFKEFIFNKYVGSCEQNELINTVIEYSKKDVTNELFLQMIAFIKFEIMDKDNIELAYKAYKVIKDFNSSKIIQECHRNICDELIEKKCFDDSTCFSFLDDILLNCQIGYDTYLDALLAVINALIDSSEFEKANEYLKTLEKIAPETKDYYSCLYRIDTKQNYFSRSLLTYIDQGDIKKITDDIDNANPKAANWILNNLIETISSFFKEIDIDRLSDVFFALKGYSNTQLDTLTENLITYCISNPNSKTDKLFEVILQTFSDNQKNKFIDCIFGYAKAYMEKDDFVSAKKYLKYALKYDQTNLSLLNGILYASIDCANETDAYRNFYKLKDYDIIEKILGLQKNDDEMARMNAKFVAQTISYVSKYGKSSNKAIFDVFEQLIRYYPIHSTDQLIKDLYDMADICKEGSLFEETEKYYALIVGIDPSENAAYWGMLQAKLRCKNETEMIHQDVLINTFPEFNNAITAADNKTIIEKYIDCSLRQQKYLEAKRRKRKFRKTFAFITAISASVLLLIALVFALTVNVFIPNSRYENALSLINNGDYSQAYEELKDFDYADSSSQLSVAKAGMAFDRGDYEEGIESIYNVGGVTNVSYDGNGGKAPLSSQTIKRMKGFVENEPFYVGYNFYGWSIDSFSIKTRKNNYSCDLKLKATWKLVDYSISYILNGSTLENKVEKYNCLSEDFSIGEPKKKGYTFDGWSGTRLSELTKDVVIPHGSVGNRTYEAHFTAKDYKVTYDYGYDGKTSESTATYNSRFNTESPSRDGYDFSGWTYNGEEFHSGIWNVDSDVTLVARWKAKKYNITYILNGGHNSPANLSTYTIETPTFFLSDPNKNGYDFLGWSGTGINGISKDVAIENGSIGDKMYTANWKPHTYKITFDAKGGECPISTMSVDYGSKISLPNPTRKGYTFAGWFNIKNNAKISDYTWIYFTDLDLYAKWNLKDYTIEYSLNGGINHSDNPTSYTIEDDDFSIGNPSREGYTFAGWDSILGSKQFLPTISKGTAGDITFKANWIPNLNTIIFNGNGNTSGGMAPIQGYTDSTISLPTNAFEKTGYHFRGWSLSENGIIACEDESSFLVSASSIINLYVIWEANINTVTFHGNGADGGEMEKQSISTDETKKLTSNGFTKGGYHFVGWSNSSEGPAEYNDGQEYSMGTESNYDLYATWEPNEYLISYNPNGGEMDVENSKVTYKTSYSLKTPSREGYFFTGWFNGDTQISDSDGNSLSPYGIIGDINVVAHWSPKTNTIILINGSERKTIKGTSESIVRLTKDAFSKDGFELLGWSETEGGDLVYFNDDLYYVGTKSSYTLYAVWKTRMETDFTNYKKISTKEELLELLNKTGTSSKYYLTNDIDLEGTKIVPKCCLFEGGELDGNGHAIRNFKLGLTNYTKNSSEYWWGARTKYDYYAGLFKRNAGAIRNLTLDSYEYEIDFDSICKPSVEKTTSSEYFNSSRLYLGTLCSISQGEITDVCITTPSERLLLSVGGEYYVGNICGMDNSSASGSISNCFVANYLSFVGEMASAHYGSDQTDNDFYFGNFVGYKEKGTVSNSIVFDSGEVDVKVMKWNDTNKYYYDFNNKFVNAFCGSGLEKAENCKKVSQVSDYSSYISFNFGNEKSFQFVNASERVVLRKNVFRKDGYEFVGWSTKADGDIQYSDEGNCFLPYGQKTLELYPVFKALTFKISFDPNAGDGQMQDQFVVCDSETKIQKNSFFKSGYHFVGWSLEKDGDLTYSDEDVLTMPSKNIALYAVWEPNQNSIVFNANGGEGNMENQSIHTNETITLAACSFMAPKGYYFAGWSSSPNGEVEYNDCSYITSDGKSVVNLYAVWESIG